MNIRLVGIFCEKRIEGLLRFVETSRGHVQPGLSCEPYNFALLRGQVLRQHRQPQDREAKRIDDLGSLITNLEKLSQHFVRDFELLEVYVEQSGVITNYRLEIRITTKPERPATLQGNNRPFAITPLK